MKNSYGKKKGSFIYIHDLHDKTLNTRKGQ